MHLEKQLYKTNSLETFVAIKKKLEDHEIKYFVKTKGNHRLGLFLVQLFTSSTATYGMSGEHDFYYYIYVSQQDYEQAKSLIIQQDIF